MIVLKEITMTLDEDSIAEAIRQVELFEKLLKPAMQCLIDYLGEKGVEIARAELIFFDDPAFRTGALSESVAYRNEEGKGIVSAGEGLVDGYEPPQSYAMYVEYGTGIYGLDLNDHGPGGWWYPAPWGTWVPEMGKHQGEPMAWTNGMPPRPFMGNTYQDLVQEAEASGARVIAEYIRGERA